MLPATFQVPAAIVLLAGGAMACFAGYRVFRLVLGVTGFLLGALMASSIVGSEHAFWMIGAALAGGLIGALILISGYFIGVAFLGALMGALLSSAIWSWLGHEPRALIVIGFAVVGALAALALQRYMIVGLTACAGAWMILVGGLALMGDHAAIAAARDKVWLVYPMNPAPGQRWLLPAWLALGIAGMIVQLSVTAKNKT